MMYLATIFSCLRKQFLYYLRRCGRYADKVALTWDVLREIGNSHFVRATIFVPLIGYLILFNEKLTKWLTLASEFVGFQPVGLTVSLNLLWVYFGLTFISFGSLTYSIWCPREVKLHGSASEYVRAERDTVSDLHAMSARTLGSRFWNRLNKAWAQHKPRLIGNYADQGGEYSYADSRADQGTQTAACLRIYYEFLREVAPIARAFSGAFFGVGFLCLLVPSAQVFLRVAKILGHVVSAWLKSWV
jgi:hypothetical protein